MPKMYAFDNSGTLKARYDLHCVESAKLQSTNQPSSWGTNTLLVLDCRGGSNLHGGCAL